MNREKKENLEQANTTSTLPGVMELDDDALEAAAGGKGNNSISATCPRCKTKISWPKSDNKGNYICTCCNNHFK